MERKVNEAIAKDLPVAYANESHVRVGNKGHP